MVKKPTASAPEAKVYGLNACKALWQNRAADIIRVYVAEPRVKELGALLRWCAQQKKAYHVLTGEELERVAASVHHEGVVFLTREPHRLADAELAGRLATLTGPSCLLYLDGVGNPHNVGSIVRVAAHFGVPLLLGQDGALPRLTPAATRIAEGGAEHLAFVALRQPAAGFAALRTAGFQVIATSSHADASLYGGPLPARSVVILGGETGGASRELLTAADQVLRIPGSGAVESLNVSVAAGLVLGEHWRRHRSGG